MKKNPELNKSFSEARIWRQEANELREVLLKAGLSEELKWSKPCYTHDGKNICIVQRMNDFLALMFFKGALLKDPDGILEVQGPNSRAGYRIRFTSVKDVARMEKSINACIREAIEVEKAGLKVEKSKDMEYPEELVAMFDEDPELKIAFDKLTPGRKRGYVMHFADAKLSKTRVARIKRFRPNILKGKGFQERS
jgi:uncharacterized protein YdeI (YjbR/CyaY-like superfamily)